VCTNPGHKCLDFQAANPLNSGVSARNPEFNGLAIEGIGWKLTDYPRGLYKIPPPHVGGYGLGGKPPRLKIMKAPTNTMMNTARAISVAMSLRIFAC
jgi:hypothetical protein